MSTLSPRHSHSIGARRLRAASLKTVLSHRLAGFATEVWTALENTARLHAASELLREASRLQATDPALSASLRALRTASTPSHPRAATVARAV